MNDIIDALEKSDAFAFQKLFKEKLEAELEKQKSNLFPSTKSDNEEDIGENFFLNKARELNALLAGATKDHLQTVMQTADSAAKFSKFLDDADHIDSYKIDPFKDEGYHKSSPEGEKKDHDENEEIPEDEMKFLFTVFLKKQEPVKEERKMVIRNGRFKIIDTAMKHGYKMVNGRLVQMTPIEMLDRIRGGKRASKINKQKMFQILRNRQASLEKLL